MHSVLGSRHNVNLDYCIFNKYIPILWIVLKIFSLTSYIIHLEALSSQICYWFFWNLLILVITRPHVVDILSSNESITICKINPCNRTRTDSMVVVVCEFASCRRQQLNLVKLSFLSPKFVGYSNYAFWLIFWKLYTILVRACVCVFMCVIFIYVVCY